MACHLLIPLFAACLVSGASAAYHTEQELAEYLAGDFENKATELCHKQQVLSFDSATDLLNATKKQLVDEMALTSAAWEKEQWLEYWKDADWKNFQDESVKRQARFLSMLGMAALDEESYSELTDRLRDMVMRYSTAKVCPYTKQQCDLETEGLPLTPDIEKILTQSRDYDELAYIWKAWRDATGAHMRGDYKEFVRLCNLVARKNGFADMGAMWRDDYEMEDLPEVVLELWRQVEPLYLALHEHVHRHLRQVYGDRMGSDGLIPAHLLGNMWAQTWEPLYGLVTPHPHASPVDVTAEMRAQNYTVVRMFRTADHFYTSLGLPANDMAYDVARGAMITKPEGREAICHASAWDMCDGIDYRIKMCTEVNAVDLVTIHHEMGHIQYFQQYKAQPISFRGSANPAFTEAIGDTMALSVTVPDHLRKIGLLPHYRDSDEADINALMHTALSKIAFLPFGLLVDLYRWDVFAGTVPEGEWNSHWWQLRERYQRVKAPVPRSEADFDPGSKYHVAGGSKYMSYFLSYIVQFQLHKALCITAGQYDPDDPTSQPLHKCDIFGSKAAGDRLAAGLSLGASKHWSEVLQALTGQRRFDGSALLEYFGPLSRYLEVQSAAAARRHRRRHHRG